MGEPLYEQVVSKKGLNRACRIYAPVGTHETLLAYLVRRLLENGANSSFINRIANLDVPVDALIADPVALVETMPILGAPHSAIVPPATIFGAERVNSAGLDLANEIVLADLSDKLQTSVLQDWNTLPTFTDGASPGTSRLVRNPADHGDVVGTVVEAGIDDVNRAVQLATKTTARWASTPVGDRAAALERAADLMQTHMPALIGLAIREAGKSASNAIAEVREAIDFLRYYAVQAKSTPNNGRIPLGPIACISPWNFPLAIFTGQVAAALATGNTVLAKPAVETPLMAGAAVRLLHEAGIPSSALQLLPGDGSIGAALVAAAGVQGVMFTGSTDVARLIQAELAKRTLPSGRPIPLIAETGGQNAMIVDSSALAEQVVTDVIASAFDSAGQRCSALRILCLQEEVADRLLTMLKGALTEYAVGRPDRLSTDIGPVISLTAQHGIVAHISRMHDLGCAVHQVPLPPETAAGTFVPPTIIEVASIADIGQEVFGPVLHVIRFRRTGLPQLIADINGTGYGLTFGLHTRLDELITEVTGQIKAGNIYVNRNMIGAVVGVQPFGGRGLSGTGPKAGGPIYLRRLVQDPPTMPPSPNSAHSPAAALADWLRQNGHGNLAEHIQLIAARSALGYRQQLAGPVGEINLYTLHPRGRILLVPQTREGFVVLLAAVLATGNSAIVAARDGLQDLMHELPAGIAGRLIWSKGIDSEETCAGALIEGDGKTVADAVQRIAARPGPLVPCQSATTAELVARPEAINLDLLLEETSISINTTAAGGNASLMALE
jgi:RHH-type proline utilization regulon transcriptional repressor/proline dehydrogenase/delta 1-pyrroline-5-carboxylate dehydrogenase